MLRTICKYMYIMVNICSYRMTLVRLTVTLRVSLLDQELLTLPEHLSYSPFFSDVHIVLSLDLCVVFCGSFVVFCLSFSLYPLYCVVLRDSASDYLCGIIKHLLRWRWKLHIFYIEISLFLPPMRFVSHRISYSRPCSFKQVHVHVIT